MGLEGTWNDACLTGCTFPQILYRDGVFLQPVALDQVQRELTHSSGTDCQELQQMLSSGFIQFDGFVPVPGRYGTWSLQTRGLIGLVSGSPLRVGLGNHPRT